MTLPLFLPCAAGVEQMLADELAGILPTVGMRPVRGGVGLDGGPLEVMKLNLECRLAQRVLVEVAEGPYQCEDDIYALGRSVDWGQWITPAHTLRVDTTATRSPLRSLNFVALRMRCVKPPVNGQASTSAIQTCRCCCTSARSVHRFTSTVQGNHCLNAVGARTKAMRR